MVSMAEIKLYKFKLKEIISVQPTFVAENSKPNAKSKKMTPNWATVSTCKEWKQYARLLKAKIDDIQSSLHFNMSYRKRVSMTHRDSIQSMILFL